MTDATLTDEAKELIASGLYKLVDAGLPTQHMVLVHERTAPAVWPVLRPPAPPEPPVAPEEIKHERSEPKEAPAVRGKGKGAAGR